MLNKRIEVMNETSTPELTFDYYYCIIVVHTSILCKRMCVCTYTIAEFVLTFF